MNKRKVLIHGADTNGEKLMRRIDSIFDVVGFIDRDRTRKLRGGVRVYSDIFEYNGDVDFILCMVSDFNGLLREYMRKGIPFEKVLDFRHIHYYQKCILHQTLSNEILRKNIPGSIAELGVDFGDAAKYLNLYYPERTLYLFDTFSGFDKRDRDVSQARTEEDLDFYNVRSNAEDVLGRMFYPESCVVKEGYFPESLDGLEDRFAFVHIDCDLYKPITAGLEYFYPRVNPGGYIVVHDFYDLAYPKAEKAVQDFADKNGLSFVTDFFSGSAIFCK